MVTSSHRLTRGPGLISNHLPWRCKQQVFLKLYSVLNFMQVLVVAVPPQQGHLLYSNDSCFWNFVYERTHQYQTGTAGRVSRYPSGLDQQNLVQASV
jgi:hypothetical protein